MLQPRFDNLHIATARIQAISPVQPDYAIAMYYSSTRGIVERMASIAALRQHRQCQRASDPDWLEIGT